MKGLASIEFDIPEDYYNDDPVRYKDIKIILKNMNYVKEVLHFHLHDEFYYRDD